MARTSDAGTKRLTTREDLSTPSTAGENTRNAFRDMEERMLRLEGLNRNQAIALGDRDIQIANLRVDVTRLKEICEAQAAALRDYEGRMEATRVVARERLLRIDRAVAVLTLRNGG